MEERRRYVRIPDDSSIAYKIIATEKSGEHVVRDISQGGIRFFVHDFIPKDSSLKVKFTLNKSSSATVEALVRLVWIKEVPHTNRFEIGVRFIDIPEKAVEHLVGYIKAFVVHKYK